MVQVKLLLFLLPILEELLGEKNNLITPILRALILVPTRELATQIVKAVDDYAKYMDIEKLAVLVEFQQKNRKEKIAKGIDILVATSGRLMEHIKIKALIYQVLQLL